MRLKVNILSIHINKSGLSKVKGIELYTPSDINYDLAKDIVNNITNNTSLGYSSNRLYKKFDGIYTHNFTESEVKSAIDGYDEKIINIIMLLLNLIIYI